MQNINLNFNMAAFTQDPEETKKEEATEPKEVGNIDTTGDTPKEEEGAEESEE